MLVVRNMKTKTHGLDMQDMCMQPTFQPIRSTTVSAVATLVVCLALLVVLRPYLPSLPPR